MLAKDPLIDLQHTVQNWSTQDVLSSERKRSLSLNLEKHVSCGSLGNVKTTQCWGSRKQNMFTQNFPPHAADILTSTLEEQTQKQQCFLILKRQFNRLMTNIRNISTPYRPPNYHQHHPQEMLPKQMFDFKVFLLLITVIFKSIPQKDGGDMKKQNELPLLAKCPS